MKKYFITFLLAAVLAGFSATAQQTPKWLRFPAISPDGSTILFCYMGNIYSVSAGGGVATPKTTGSDYCTRPVWSHDGKTIAYASNKYGRFDVFTIPAAGGKPTRLTYNAANDYPLDFTPDNSKVLFRSERQAPASCVRFPDPGYFNNLYTIPAGGGRPILLTSVGADEAKFNSDGTKIIYQDKKGYEDEWRKHHVSSVTRDIWIYDISANTYTKVSDFKGEDRTPLFASDGANFFYANEKDGTMNLYRRGISGGTESQLTHYKDFPVREVSISNDNKLAYVWKGEIYTLANGGEPKKLDVIISDNSGYDAVRTVTLNNMSEALVNPNGKELAFVSRGEVFVTGVKDPRTKRVTNTPYQERMIEWSKDGKYLYYSAEKDGKWGIYRTSLKDTTEKYFFASTLLNSEPIVVEDGDNFQPKCSPDNKMIAYVSERNTLKVLTLATKATVTVLPTGHNHSYSDGDWSFSWSPDSKWLLVDDQKDYMAGVNTALISADGKGDIRYPVNSGFSEFNSKWGMDGKMMTYLCSRDGLKGPSFQSDQETDIYAVFFDKAAYDKFNLSKEDYALLEEKEAAEKAAKDSTKTDSDKNKSKKKDKNTAKADSSKDVKPLKIDFDNIEMRKVRITGNSGNICDYVFTKDGSKVFYLQKATKGYDLWMTEPRTDDTKLFAKLGTSPSALQLSPDESTIYLINNPSSMTVDAKTGESKPITIRGTMELNTAGEREYIFNHVWLQVKKKFYDPTIHGINWQMYHDEYAKFLPYINNSYDFQVLLSELLGELNASHTGGRFRPSLPWNTASLGLLFDEKYTGDGIKIDAVIPGGPADKADVKIKAGDIITAINGTEIKAGDNWNQYLNDISGNNTLLTVKSGSSTYNQDIRPIPSYNDNGLMYRRWTQIMEKMVDSLSGGRLGYVHVEGMDDGSYREVYEKALGKFKDKEALVVDTRFNGGGWLHDDLNTFLSGKHYMSFAPQSEKLKGGESAGRWCKPSIVLVSEGNYSDAFMFPYSYQQNKIGKIVGMPVPGTGTAVWWENQIDPTIIFGIPMIASIGTDGVVTENTELEPDIKVELPYNDCINGRDPQIEAAVKDLLNQLGK